MYYVQTKSLSGNWVDYAGFDKFLEAKKCALFVEEEHKKRVRIVLRKDTSIYFWRVRNK